MVLGNGLETDHDRLGYGESGFRAELDAKNMLHLNSTRESVFVSVKLPLLAYPRQMPSSGLCELP